MVENSEFVRAESDRALGTVVLLLQQIAWRTRARRADRRADTRADVPDRYLRV